MLSSAVLLKPVWFPSVLKFNQPIFKKKKKDIHSKVKEKSPKWHFASFPVVATLPFTV